MNYEPHHYLYGKTDGQITTLAQSAIDIYGKPSGRDTDVYERSAAIHELKRLTLANETKREAIINRNERIAELKSTHPPEDWLTRAVAKSGAPDGSDWAGLLEHVGKQKADVEFAKSRLHVVRSLISGRDDRIEELEAKLTMTEATAAQLGIGPLIPVKATPTQPNLARIASALEQIATKI